MSAYVENLRAIYSSATDEQKAHGQGWYRYAQAFATAKAYEHGYPVENVATALAHLSPRVHWSRNKDMLSELLATGDTVGLRSAIERAQRALESPNPLGTLNGPKTRAFAHNILGYYDMVTVDVWAARAAMGTDEVPTLKGKRYDDIANAYATVAKEFGETPAQTQAIVWVVQRGKAQ